MVTLSCQKNGTSKATSINETGLVNAIKMERKRESEDLMCVVWLSLALGMIQSDSILSASLYQIHKPKTTKIKKNKKKNINETGTSQSKWKKIIKCEWVTQKSEDVFCVQHKKIVVAVKLCVMLSRLVHCSSTQRSIHHAAMVEMYFFSTVKHKMLSYQIIPISSVLTLFIRRTHHENGLSYSLSLFCSSTWVAFAKFLISKSTWL